MSSTSDCWLPKFWTGWVAAAAVSFAVVERHALRYEPRLPRNTLSGWLRWSLCRNPARLWLSLIVWLVFVAWFTEHIWWHSNER